MAVTLTSQQFQQAITAAQQYLPGIQQDVTYTISPGTTILFDSSTRTITLTTNVNKNHVANIVHLVYAYPSNYANQGAGYPCKHPCPYCDRTEALWASDPKNTKKLAGLTQQYVNVVYTS